MQLTRDQLIRQVLQGSGEMPAYGDHLRPAEVAALVFYLQTKRPPDERAVRASAASSISGR